MNLTLQHWLSTDQGGDRPNGDAFLWLNEDETGGLGSLWFVVDGEGGKGVGDLAAAVIALTVREQYGPLLAQHGNPASALEAALREADRRMGVLSEAWPRLAGMRASYAALAHFRGQLYPMVAGSASILVATHQGVERVGELDIARRQNNASDPDLVPGSGLGVDGPIFHSVGDPRNAELVSVLLCTDGVTEMSSDEFLAQALERLNASDASRGVIEVARKRWGDDDATAAVIRFVDPALQVSTSLKAFLDWAESGLTKWPDKTLILQVSREANSTPPPSLSVTHLPNLDAEQAAPGGPVDEARSIMEGLQAVLRGDRPVAAVVAAPTPVAAPASSSGAPVGTGTLVMSADELAKLQEMHLESQAAASRGAGPITSPVEGVALRKDESFDTASAMPHRGATTTPTPSAGPTFSGDAATPTTADYFPVPGPRDEDLATVQRSRVDLAELRTGSQANPWKWVAIFAISGLLAVIGWLMLKG